jgi:arylformamidase
MGGLETKSRDEVPFVSGLTIPTGATAIDLSMPIEEHWRFRPAISYVDKDVAGYHFRSTMLQIGAHGFTHVDSPRHVHDEGEELGAIGLDHFWGPAVVLDLSHLEGEAITAEQLAAAAASAGGVTGQEIVLLRTDQGVKHPPTTSDFWIRSPWLSAGGARWLLASGVRAVGYDFPQDRAIRSEYDEAWQAGELIEEWACHELLLKAGVLQIEYLTNLASAPTRCLLFALPLNVPTADGAPARVVALPCES